MDYKEGIGAIDLGSGKLSARPRSNSKRGARTFGHEKVLTTFLSYGQVESPRQGAIIRDLAKPQAAVQSDVSQLAKALMREMRDSGGGTPVM